MRLPVELRLRIYEVVLGQRKVHVAYEFAPHEYRTYKRREVLEWRWWHSICSWDMTEYEPWKNIFHDQCRGKGSVYGNPGPPNGMMGRLKLDVSLLWTCRTMWVVLSTRYLSLRLLNSKLTRRRYSEAIDILYSTTTFNFANHELLRSFPSLVVPQRFAAITSIEMTWIFVNLGIYIFPNADITLYNEMWAMLADMPHLRHLKIAVAAYECPQPVPLQLQETWLEPLDRLKGKPMQVFEVQVPESYGRHFHVDETSHFKLSTFPDIVLSVCTLGTM
ncbi:hypothetical protein D0Z07_5877 [Hyphodiscus hymeniophilus]|uniref:DUF7730 domain-containing protein n=1 Tax=Hyphodiscus hymeniophilus TaxID=353542 RepID=A0A9P7AW88_9HELO|nr:hypothetical protein D0Z07_5877 [Hyphodiscus hymeniophilus]